VTRDLAGDQAFIRAHTELSVAALVPEFRLWLATEITPIWQASESWLEAEGVAPPFWAFAWPGSQAIARMVLDDAIHVAGRRVLDFAAGGGLAGMAAARAGAVDVEAAEIDTLAVAAIGLNALENGVDMRAVFADVVGSACRWDVILCGDVCYEGPMTRHIFPWLRQMARAGAEVWIADPGRAYLPVEALVEIGRFCITTTRELEDREERETRVFRVSG